MKEIEKNIEATEKIAEKQVKDLLIKDFEQKRKYGIILVHDSIWEFGLKQASKS